MQGEQKWEQTQDEAPEGLPWTFYGPAGDSSAAVPVGFAKKDPGAPKFDFSLGSCGPCNTPELCLLQGSFQGLEGSNSSPKTNSSGKEQMRRNSQDGKRAGDADNSSSINWEQFQHH